MRLRRSTLAALVTSSALVLAGCAQTPMEPTVQVMPGGGKSFEAFQYDQASCKQFAEQSVAGQAQNTNTRAVDAAALGTVLGAGLGAAVGGGRGAAIGAGSGAIVGTGVGMAVSSNEQLSIQQQYDSAFAQCVYARGEMVPGYGPTRVQAPPPPPPYGGDPRVHANPLLTQIAQNSPQALPEFLHELDQITLGVRAPLLTKASGTALSVPIVSLTQEEATQLQANPDIARAYRANPDPMLELLRRMMAAAKIK